jgi:hypothetical protein
MKVPQGERGRPVVGMPSGSRALAGGHNFARGGRRDESGGGEAET